MPIRNPHRSKPASATSTVSLSTFGIANRSSTDICTSSPTVPTPCNLRWFNTPTNRSRSLTSPAPLIPNSIPTFANACSITASVDAPICRILSSSSALFSTRSPIRSIPCARRQLLCAGRELQMLDTHRHQISPQDCAPLAPNVTIARRVKVLRFAMSIRAHQALRYTLIARCHVRPVYATDRSISQEPAQRSENRRAPDPDRANVICLLKLVTRQRTRMRLYSRENHRPNYLIFSQAHLLSRGHLLYPPSPTPLVHLGIPASPYRETLGLGTDALPPLMAGPILSIKAALAPPSQPQNPSAAAPPPQSCSRSHFAKSRHNHQASQSPRQILAIALLHAASVTEVL